MGYKYIVYTLWTVNLKQGASIQFHKTECPYSDHTNLKHSWGRGWKQILFPRELSPILQKLFFN